MRITQKCILSALYLSAGMAPFLIGGCAIYHSTASPEAPGLYYYLPKTYLSVTVRAVGVKGWDGVDKKKRDYKKDRVKYFDFEKIVASKQPDNTAPLILQYQRNALTTDHVCAGVENGLLVAVEAASADETGNIIVSLAKLAGRFSGPSPFADRAAPEREEIEGVEDLERSFTLEIDPLNESDRTSIVKQIELRFSAAERELISYEFYLEGADALNSPAGTASCPEDAICYRTEVPVRLVLRTKTGAVTSVKYAPVANRSIVGHVKVTRAFMVEKITRLTFDDGVLKGVAIRKPSEALAVAQLPLTIVDAVLTSALAAPGRFVANFSGLPATQYVDLVKQASANAKEVEQLRAELLKIRQGDLVIDGRYKDSTTDPLYSVRCSRTFGATKPS